MPNRRTMAGFLGDLLGRSPERVAGVELWANARVAGTTGTARIDARYATR
jgi:hypothetical protein